MKCLFECGAPAEVDHHVVPQSMGGNQDGSAVRSMPRQNTHHADRNMSSSKLTTRTKGNPGLRSTGSPRR